MVISEKHPSSVRFFKVMLFDSAIMKMLCIYKKRKMKEILSHSYHMVFSNYKPMKSSTHKL